MDAGLGVRQFLRHGNEECAHATPQPPAQSVVGCGTPAGRANETLRRDPGSSSYSAARVLAVDSIFFAHLFLEKAKNIGKRCLLNEQDDGLVPESHSTWIDNDFVEERFV